MTVTSEAQLQRHYQTLSGWLHASALEDWDVPTLQAILVQRLESFGIPLFRMHIGLPMLHPLYSVGTYTWVPGEGVVTDNFSRGLATSDPWMQSPLRPFYENGDDEGRIRLTSGSDFDHFPVLKFAVEHGATDYFVQLTHFPDRSMPVDGQEGIALSWTSASPDGFSEDNLALLRMIRAPLCAQLKNLTHRRLVDDILNAYLGTYSASRVHNGQIQRGDGDVVEAVVLFCDLRGSSMLAEHYGLTGFLSVLNDYYEITAGAVLDGGGEVLRYIGDASLAVFPLERYKDRSAACSAALEAAQRAVSRGNEVNCERERRGEPRIEFGIGLHVGTVLYGNIGTAERLEFTVIGPAANEAARIEAQCKEIDETLLVSDEFAQSISRPWRSHGTFELRNIGRPIEIFSPAHTGEPETQK